MEENDKRTEGGAKAEPPKGSILSALERKISSGGPQKPPEQKMEEPEGLSAEESPSLEKDLNPASGENISETIKEKGRETGAAGAAIRTYEGDVAKTIQTGASLSSIALSEKRRQAETGEAERKDEAKKNRKFLIVVLSAVLIVAGISLLGWLIWGSYFGEDSAMLPLEAVHSLITANRKTEVPADKDSAKRTMEALSQSRDKVSLSLGLLEELILVSGEGAEKAPLGSAEFLNLIEAGAGSAFLRSLDKSFFLGVHVFNGNQPVLILKTDSYGEAFAGMLAWEKTIVRDLSPLFDTQKSFSTSTPASFRAGETPWRDIVVKNRDARAVYLDGEKTRLLWAIPDRKTIIIATNPNSLIEVLSRLGNPSI